MAVIAAPLPGRVYWPTLAGICLLALLLRLAMLAEYVQENPVAEVPWSDGQTYWSMAERMAGGQWIGEMPFLSAPLYPYFLGVIRTVGGGLGSVYAIQTLLHLATAVVIAATARLRFGGVAGLISAALFLALTEPAVSSSRILASTVQLLAAALLWWRWAALAECGRHRWRDLIAVGCLIGLFALSYPAAILFVPVYPMWLWWAGGRRGAAMGRALAGLACSAAVIAPATLHNAWVSHELIPITAHAGITMLQGNTGAADGTYTPVAGISQARRFQHESAARIFAKAHGREGTWREIDHYFRGFVYEFWSEHPWRAGKLFARKAYWFLSARNYDDMMPTVLEREYGVCERAVLAPLPTPWIIGAALAGLLVLVRRPVHYAPEWLLLALPLLVVIIFFYSPRYRLPAIPVLCGLAACTLVHMRRLWYPKPMAAGLCVLPLVLSAVNYGVGFDTADYMRESYAPMLSLAHVRTGDRRLAEGDTAAGERSYRAALNVVELNGMAHRQLGALYAQLGRPRDALAEFTEALRCYRRFHYPYWEYGEDITYRHLYNLRLQFGDTATAVAVLRQAARAHPQIAETRLALAWRLATIPDDRLRSADEALEHAEAARRLMPESNVQTLDVLAAAYAEAGHFEQAASTAAAALELARHNHQQAAQIAARLAAYRNHQPWRARPGLMHIPRSDW